MRKFCFFTLMLGIYLTTFSLLPAFADTLLPEDRPPHTCDALQLLVNEQSNSQNSPDENSLTEYEIKKRSEIHMDDEKVPRSSSKEFLLPQALLNPTQRQIATLVYMKEFQLTSSEAEQLPPLYVCGVIQSESRLKNNKKYKYTVHWALYQRPEFIELMDNLQKARSKFSKNAGGYRGDHFFSYRRPKLTYVPSSLSAIELSSVDRALLAEIIKDINSTVKPDYDKGDVFNRTLDRTTIDFLLELRKHPDYRDLLTIYTDTILRSVPLYHRPSSVAPTYDGFIDYLVAQLEWKRAAKSLGGLVSEKFDDTITDRGVRTSSYVQGQIRRLSGEPRTGLPVEITFEELQNSHGFEFAQEKIHWVVVPATRGEKITSDQVIADSVLYFDSKKILHEPRKNLIVTFKQSGTYEVHAFVEHTLELPKHFYIEVCIQTEKEILEADTNVQMFAKRGKQESYVFQSVIGQNIKVEVGLLTLTGGLGGVLMALTPPSETAGTLNDYANGFRETGDLATVEYGSPIERASKQMEAKIDRLEQLIRIYDNSPPSSQRDDLLKWCKEARTRLEATKKTLDALASSQVTPVWVSGTYVNRKPNQYHGPLNLLAWFTYDAEEDQYSAHLFDYSRSVRDEDLHFTATGSTYKDVMENLFFQITCTYPDGIMNFAYHLYEEKDDGIFPTPRYVMLTRRTDTVLKDIRQTIFSQPARLTVDIFTTILTLFPPTTPAGVSINLAYNGAAKAFEIDDNIQTDTLRFLPTAVGLGTLVLDLVPLIGPLNKTFEIGEKTYRLVNATQIAGAGYLVLDEVFDQIVKLRDRELADLAILYHQLNSRKALKSDDPADSKDPELSKLLEKIKQAEDKARLATKDILTEAVLTQGITVVSTIGYTTILQGLVGGRYKRTYLPDLEEVPFESMKPQRAQTMDAVPSPVPREAPLRIPTKEQLVDNLVEFEKKNVNVQKDNRLLTNESVVTYNLDRVGIPRNVRVLHGSEVPGWELTPSKKVAQRIQRCVGVAGLVSKMLQRQKWIMGSVQTLAVNSLRPLSTGFTHNFPGWLQDCIQLAQSVQHYREFYDYTDEAVDWISERYQDLSDFQDTSRSNFEELAGLGTKKAADNLMPPAPEGHIYFLPSGSEQPQLKTKPGSGVDKLMVVKGEGGEWKFVPDKRKKDWASQQEAMIGQYGPQYGKRLEKIFPELEQALNGKTQQAGWTEAEKASIRKWSVSIQGLYNQLPVGKKQKFLDQLLSSLETGGTEASYRKFRHELRSQQIDFILHDPSSANPVTSYRSPVDQITLMRNFIASDPTSGSQGALFHAYVTERLQIPAGQQGHVPGMTSLKDPSCELASSSIQAPGNFGKRRIDGAVSVPNDLPTLTKGVYGIESKAGQDPFDVNQAKNYSTHLFSGNGNLVMADQTIYQGIIYVFENPSAANSARAVLSGLHPNIHVAYFDAQGGLVCFSRGQTVLSRKCSIP